MTLEELAQLGPVATGIAATVALVVGIATIIQRARADGRSEWWRRTQWALDLTLHDDPARQEVGLRALQHLAESNLAGREEARMLEAAWKVPLMAEDDQPLAGGTEPEDTEAVPGDSVDEELGVDDGEERTRG